MFKKTGESTLLTPIVVSSPSLEDKNSSKTSSENLSEKSGNTKVEDSNNEQESSN